MPAELTGPRLDAEAAPAKRLVVFLHGYGADGNDLIELGRQWRKLLPDAAFVSPHAPDRCVGAPTGRQWFSLNVLAPNDARGEDERWRGVVAARPALDAFLDAELQRLGLDDSRLALVGFSQGSMMALHVGLRRKQPPAAILGYSGLLVLPGDEPAAIASEITGHPPILLIHGDSDDLIPADALFQSAQDLAALDIPVEWHLSHGLGHGIDGEGLRHGGEFLIRRLAAGR